MGKCLFLRKGETHTAPVDGTPIGTLSVGSIVKLNVDGTATDFLVVNQGIPGGSSLYSSSCNGTWLLMKDIYVLQFWDGEYNYRYSASLIANYLSERFLNLLAPELRSTIITACIPQTGDYTEEVASGDNGYATKIFLLSGYEIGLTTDINSTIPVDGAILSYFLSGDTADAASKRIAYYNGTATNWWTRSSDISQGAATWGINSAGYSMQMPKKSGQGIRPALILPFDTLVKSNGTIKI